MSILRWVPHWHRWDGCICKWCGRDRHELDEECRCRICGDDAHVYDLEIEWIEEEGMDAETGWPWMAYDHVEEEVKRCRRCGHEGGRRRTGRAKGPG